MRYFLSMFVSFLIGHFCVPYVLCVCLIYNMLTINTFSWVDYFHSIALCYNFLMSSRHFPSNLQYEEHKIKKLKCLNGIDVSCQHPKYHLGNIGYMFIIFEPIANGTRFYPYLHICKLSNLPVMCRSITCHGAYIMCHLLSPHKRGERVPLTSPIVENKYV